MRKPWWGVGIYTTDMRPGKGCAERMGAMSARCLGDQQNEEFEKRTYIIVIIPISSYIFIYFHGKNPKRISKWVIIFQKNLSLIPVGGPDMIPPKSRDLR